VGDQTPAGWDFVVTGPVAEVPLNPHSAAVENVQWNGHRYDVLGISWGWTEATIPLTAPDCLCAADFNADGAVDQGDLDMVLLNWGEFLLPGTWPHQQPDVVRQSSLDAVLLAWGDVSPAKLMGTSAVPEPSAMLLAAIVIAAACVPSAPSAPAAIMH
jgi:hypothetical protein